MKLFFIISRKVVLSNKKKKLEKIKFENFFFFQPFKNEMFFFKNILLKENPQTVLSIVTHSCVSPMNRKKHRIK